MIHNYSSAEAIADGNCGSECPDVLITADPPSGSALSFPTFVTLSVNVPEAVIHYTTDGTEPVLASPIYTGPIEVTSPNLGIRGRGFIDGCTPGAIANVQYTNTSFPLVFSYACDTPDKGGVWEDFTPNGNNDHHWQLQFTLAGATTIKRLELFQLDSAGLWTTGQVWSTDSPINPPELANPFDVFPLVVFIAAVQQWSDYQSSLGSFGAATHTWDLYGDTVIAAGGLFRLDIILDDGTKLSQTIDATCVGSPPPICPPPATPTATGKCAGAVDVTFSGTVGRSYIIYFKSDICGPGGWEEAVAGTIDVSPKTVEVSGLTNGCPYSFYVSIDEVGCGFRDSSPVSATPMLDPLVTISTSKTVVNPNESFTISWTSNHIGGAVCGGCLDGEVSLNQSMGCKAGNVSGSDAQSQAVCGVYTYQITGCNTCGTAIASVEVEVRCPAECSGAQPARVQLGSAGNFLCDSADACNIGFFVSQYLWDGTLYRQTGCGYLSPTTGEVQKFISGCIEPVSTIWRGHVLDVIVDFVPSGPYAGVPYFQLGITGLSTSGAVSLVWAGIKTVGNTVDGVYNQVDGCAEVAQMTISIL